MKLGEIQDGFWEPRVCQGWVWGLSRRSGMGRETIREVRVGSGELRGVRDATGNRWGNPRRVWGSSSRFGMGRGTLGEVRNGSETQSGVRDESWGTRGYRTSHRTLREVRDGSEDHREGLGRVGGTSGRSKMGRGTLRDVRDGSGDTWGGLGWVGGPSGRSGTGRDPRGSPRRVWGTNRRSGTGWGTLMEVWDGSREATGGPGRVG